LYGGLKPTRKDKAVMVVGHENGNSMTYNIRTKTEEQAEELLKALEREIEFVKAKQPDAEVDD
jgi:nucleoporin NUP2